MMIGEKTINEANIGYLPAMVLKEIKAGRKCELTGGVYLHVKDMAEYTRVLSKLRGKFGEVIQWKADRTALIATRAMPVWAIDAMEKELPKCEEMERWLM
jgi:hypothetical protein